MCACVCNLYVTIRQYFPGTSGCHINKKQTECVGDNANFTIRVRGNTHFSIFRLPACWYMLRKIVALGVQANASTQREWFCIAVEYRLYNFIISFR